MIKKVKILLLILATFCSMSADPKQAIRKELAAYAAQEEFNYMKKDVMNSWLGEQIKSLKKRIIKLHNTLNEINDNKIDSFSHKDLDQDVKMQLRVMVEYCKTLETDINQITPL